MCSNSQIPSPSRSYTRANKHQDALRIYLDLGRLEAFELIEKQNLFQTVKVWGTG